MHSPSKQKKAAHWAMALALLAGATATGCGDPEPERILKPDFSITPTWGIDGPYGVAKASIQVTILIDRKAEVDVYLPMDTDEDLAAGPFVPVVIAQGSPVPAERYAWLAKHATSWGHLVLVPHHPFNMPIFDSARLVEVLQAVRRLSNSDHSWLAGKVSQDAAVAIGHSQGGVVAAQAWNDQPGEVGSLVMLAAYPAFDKSTRDAFKESTINASTVDRGRVVTLWGDKDGYVDRDEFTSSLDAYGKSPIAAIIEGMNHMQFSDDPTEGEMKRDQEATLSESAARGIALFLVDGALAEARGEDASAMNDMDLWPQGLVEAAQ